MEIQGLQHDKLGTCVNNVLRSVMSLSTAFDKLAENSNRVRLQRVVISSGRVPRIERGLHGKQQELDMVFR